MLFQRSQKIWLYSPLMSLVALDKLMKRGLIVHQSRLKKKPSRWEVSVREGDRYSSRGQGRGMFRGRRWEKGRETSIKERIPFNGQSHYKGNIQCFNCKMYSHIKAECKFKDKEINLVKENEVRQLFMAHCDIEMLGSIWLVDNGCFKHDWVERLVHWARWNGEDDGKVRR